MKFSNHVIAGLLLTVSGSALAAGTISGMSTKSVDLNFVKKAGEVNLTLTPAEKLYAGIQNVNTILADMDLKATDPEKIAFRFNNGAGFDATSPIVGVAYGKNDPTNKLDVTMMGVGPSQSVTTDEGQVWWVTGNVVSEYKVNITSGNKQQDVKADTYTLYVDAGVYNL